MKRTHIIMALTLLMVFLSFSCGSNSRRIDGNVPASVKRAVSSVPDDALVGIGTSRLLSSMSLSRTVAHARAIAHISLQLQAVVSRVVADYTITEEANSDSEITLRETVTSTVSESRIANALIVHESYVGRQYWVVVMLERDDAKAEIMSASESAIGLIPSADAVTLALEQQSKATIVVSGN